MRESTIEQRLRTKLKRLGCLCYKFTSPGTNGVPDRIVVTPDGVVYFVELKTREGRLSPEQCIQLRKLREHNARVTVLYGREDVDIFIEGIRREVRAV